jgi:hypothetical protein
MYMCRRHILFGVVPVSNPARKDWRRPFGMKHDRSVGPGDGVRAAKSEGQIDEMNRNVLMGKKRGTTDATEPIKRDDLGQKREEGSVEMKKDAKGGSMYRELKVKRGKLGWQEIRRWLKDLEEWREGG